MVNEEDKVKKAEEFLRDIGREAKAGAEGVIGLGERLGRDIGHIIAERGRVEIMDVGDVEAVKFRGGVVVSMPRGKDTLFITLPRGLTRPSVKKLSEVTATA